MGAASRLTREANESSSRLFSPMENLTLPAALPSEAYDRDWSGSS
jgi:hypothetical protein